MGYSFDRAKYLLGLLRERTDGMDCEIATGERRGMVPDDERHTLRLITPDYEIESAILTVLHRTGPFTLRHLGQVGEDHDGHVWLLKPSDADE